MLHPPDRRSAKKRRVAHEVHEGKTPEALLACDTASTTDSSVAGGSAAGPLTPCSEDTDTIDPEAPCSAVAARRSRVKGLLPASVPPDFDLASRSKMQADVLIGVDEVGRGCLAGPVVTCACSVPVESMALLNGVNDSKQLTEPHREQVYSSLTACPGMRFQLCAKDPEEIDASNILEVTMAAMASAVEDLLRQLVPRLQSEPPKNAPPSDDTQSSLQAQQRPLRCHVLVDGNKIPPRLQKLAQQGFVAIESTRIRLTCEAVVKGDSKSFSIASASILAKVTRDRQLIELGAKFPEYGLENHKGYATQDHITAIEKHGVRPFHRLTFRPICTLLLEEKSTWPEERAVIEIDPIARQIQAKKKAVALSKKATTKATCPTKQSTLTAFVQKHAA